MSVNQIWSSCVSYVSVTSELKTTSSVIKRDKIMTSGGSSHTLKPFIPVYKELNTTETWLASFLSRVVPLNYLPHLDRLELLSSQLCTFWKNLFIIVIFRWEILRTVE